MLFGVALAGAALALLGCAGQDSVVLSGGPGETGSGSFRGIGMYAVSGPSGERAGGRVGLDARVDTPRGPVFFPSGGPVRCLAVDGGNAVLNFEDQVGGFGVVTVTVHDGNPDTFGATPIGRSPTDCSPAPFIGEEPLSSGHISIVDSQPPTAASSNSSR
jgi:hypothetical protein